jgi:hypothetical protein
MYGPPQDCKGKATGEGLMPLLIADKVPQFSSYGMICKQAIKDCVTSVFLNAEVMHSRRCAKLARPSLSFYAPKKAPGLESLVSDRAPCLDGLALPTSN